MESLLSEIDELRTAVYEGVPRPHKYVLLLALADILAANPAHVNRFPLNQELEEAFARKWLEVLPGTTPGQIEYPFYHMSSHSLWKLRLKPGMKGRFNSYKSLQRQRSGRFTPRRLRETVQYAYASSDLYRALCTARGRRAVESIAIRHCRAYLEAGQPGKNEGARNDT